MANTERDPVCGMDIDPENAAAQAQYQGKTYYFCAQVLRNEFDANPQQFATDWLVSATRRVSEPQRRVVTPANPVPDGCSCILDFNQHRTSQTPLKASPSL